MDDQITESNGFLYLLLNLQMPATAFSVVTGIVTKLLLSAVRSEQEES